MIEIINVGIFVVLILINVLLYGFVFSRFIGDKNRNELYDKIYMEYQIKSKYELYKEYNIIKNDINRVSLKYIFSAFLGAISSQLINTKVFLYINSEFIQANDFTVAGYIILLCTFIAGIVIIIPYQNGFRMEIIRTIMIQRKMPC